MRCLILASVDGSISVSLMTEYASLPCTAADFLGPGPASWQIYDEVVAELKLRGAYIMSPEECKKAGATIIKDGRLNADVVGQKATALARLFGFEVPANTKVLVGEVSGIGKAEPMSFEKLCPVLGEKLWRLSVHDAILELLEHAVVVHAYSQGD